MSDSYAQVSTGDQRSAGPGVGGGTAAGPGLKAVVDGGWWMVDEGGRVSTPCLVVSLLACYMRRPMTVALAEWYCTVLCSTVETRGHRASCTAQRLTKFVYYVWSTKYMVQNAEYS